MALKSYIDKYFRYEKEKWEAPYLEFAELEEGDNNFVANYNIRYTPLNSKDDNGEKIEAFVNEASSILLRDGNLGQYQMDWNDRLLLFDFRNHLYAPLVSMRTNGLKISISPVSLNEGEKQFVDMLNDYVNHNPESLKDKSLFLLRNKSKTGIGFFEAANYYPDFILWIDTQDKQYVTFIDPKGLLRTEIDSPKIKFAETIKEIQARLQPTSGGKTIILNSFIMSSTSAAELGDWWHLDRSEREAINVYTLDSKQCISSMIEKILSD